MGHFWQACRSFLIISLLISIAIKSNASPLPIQAASLDDDIAQLQTLSKNKDLEAFRSTADDLQKKWANEDSYAELTRAICSDLVSGDFGLPDDHQQRTLAEQYTETALAKSPGISLAMRSALVMYLRNIPTGEANGMSASAWRKLRNRRAKLWLDTWQQLDRSASRTMVFRQPLMPPAPPDPKYFRTRYVMLDGRVNPNDIADPLVRKNYEAQLAAYDKIGKDYYDWEENRRTEEYFYPATVQFLIAAYSSAPYDMKEMHHYLNLYLPDQTLRRLIVALVWQKIKKVPEQP